ncbi:hypothetical protein KFL_000040210 [Klebsormidium nitens]|uniref:Secondary thiamine-phosphate synthase enzyme n=1 Tax=Klebsormidium nitens TaxID=105231 RepID=A0A1Y1HL00_KLENI|nr:hypothetical protein KFL_000040210 [Klebsormidium nitens]|eukprot:GAQ77819.1 hypothetical protein KFL_000040210 [Klebsormidium nitens]
MPRAISSVLFSCSPSFHSAANMAAAASANLVRRGFARGPVLQQGLRGDACIECGVGVAGAQTFLGRRVAHTNPSSSIANFALSTDGLLRRHKDLGKRTPSRQSTCRPICAAGEAATATQVAPTEWVQKTITLKPRPRGCHVVTGEIRNALGAEMSRFTVGLAHLFIMHTSASLTINENASPDVPLDMADSLDRIVPEGHHYRHLDEGMDDMPAHVKGSLMGFSVTIPITSGRLNMGTWQGIYLNEHRNYGGPRKLCVTIQGQVRPDGRSYQ